MLFTSPFETKASTWADPSHTLHLEAIFTGSCTPPSSALRLLMNTGQKIFRPKPPDKGSFPLDHEGKNLFIYYYNYVIALQSFLFSIQESANNTWSYTCLV